MGIPTDLRPMFLYPETKALLEELGGDELNPHKKGKAGKCSYKEYWSKRHKHYQKTSGDTKTSLRLPENSEFLRRFLEENNVDTGGRRVEASIYNHNIVLMKDQSGKPTQKFHHDFTGT